jgi:uncharacterized protein YdaU (DUF1376 family)
MAEFASLPVFTDAWVADTAHLKRAVRGLYWDWLVLMWRTPGCRVPADLSWSARKLNCTSEEIPVLEELVGEFLTRDGQWLYQKRLRKEFGYVSKKRLKNRAAAKSRWDKEKDICERNAPSPSPSPSPSQEERGSNISVKMIDAQFEEWWISYPRKVAKGAARKAFTKAIKKATLQELISGATRYAQERSDEDPQYTRHPATWLNGEGWKDQPTGDDNGNGTRKSKLDRAFDDFRRRVRKSDQDS